MVRISIIIPIKSRNYLRYLFFGLREQSLEPYEVVLIVKDCGPRLIEEMCRAYSLPCVIIEQRRGFFTHALNMGKKTAGGDLLVFTDEDAIPPPKWLKNYVKLHMMYPRAAGICSRDVYIDVNLIKLLPTPDDRTITKLYRWFVRPWLEQPHPLFKKYRLGVYIAKSYNVAHGPYIPHRECYSLPFRGVNMSFKHECMYDVWFPEHPLLRSAPGNEQYFGIQLILKGFDTVYVPNNPVLHIVRVSLSRPRDRVRVENEMKVMRSLIRSLLEKAR